MYKYFPYGGIQRDFLEIALRCRRAGNQIKVYVLKWEGDVPEGFDIVIVPVRAFTRHRLYRRYSKWVQADLLVNPVDLVVGINKMPSLDVYYAGDSCFEEVARNQRSKIYRYLPRYRHFSDYEAAVFDRDSSTQILMISKIQQEYFKKYYKTQEKRIDFLPPGISRDRVAPENVEDLAHTTRLKEGISLNERLLLFVGSGFIKKGLARALKAYSSLSPSLKNRTRFFIVGEDNQFFYRCLATLLSISDKVKFLGGREDVPSYLFAADLLILPALDENTGTVILESIVSGTPVLASDNCGYSHYINESGMGSVISSPFNQKDLNDRLECLLQNSQRELMLEKSKAFVREADIFSLHDRAVKIIQEIGMRSGSYIP
ncbi:MAG: glucosyltransferase I RfaG [Gammaproteobacteria bacterium]|nr:glucosyltransferase I RfaG [Gammaproteobacteria bacterium]